MPAQRPPLFRSLSVWIGAGLAAYWTLIFVLTHIPAHWLTVSFADAGEFLSQGGDKPLHVLAYAGLAFLLVSWLTLKQGFEAKQYLRTAIIVALYAVVDELLQIPVRRTADVWDVAADLCGLAIGLGVHAVAVHILRPGRPAESFVPHRTDR